MNSIDYITEIVFKTRVDLSKYVMSSVIYILKIAYLTFYKLILHQNQFVFI